MADVFVVFDVFVVIFNHYKGLNWKIKEFRLEIWNDNSKVQQNPIYSKFSNSILWANRILHNFTQYYPGCTVGINNIDLCTNITNQNAFQQDAYRPQQ